MTPVEVLGWVCAALGSVGLLPQTIKLVRDQDTEGISLWFWQALLAIGIAWSSHGLKIGQANMVVPNVIMTVTCLFTLWLLMRDRGLAFVSTFAPSAALAVGLIATDLMLGSVVYGLVVMVPGVAGAVSQLREIVTAASVTGVSRLFLVFNLLIQAGWVTWGTLVGDPSTMINSTALVILASVTLASYVRRVLVPRRAPQEA